MNKAQKQKEIDLAYLDLERQWEQEFDAKCEEYAKLEDEADDTFLDYYEDDVEYISATERIKMEWDEIASQNAERLEALEEAEMEKNNTPIRRCSSGPSEEQIMWAIANGYEDYI